MSQTTDIADDALGATASRAYANTLGRLYADAKASFAPPTPATAVGDEPSARRHTAATTVADPGVIADLADAPELRAVEELRAWLYLSYEDVARVAGLSGPSLLHHWRKRHRTGSPVRPRASTLERLWRAHALVRAVAEALEGAGSVNATRLWFRRPEVGGTALELLLVGEIDEVERRSAPLLFDPVARATPPWRTAALEHDPDLEAVRGALSPYYKDNDFG